MDYFDYRELRTLMLQSRLLAYRIKMERLQAKPNRFRLLNLRKLRFAVLERISGYLQKSAQHDQTQLVATS